MLGPALDQLVRYCLLNTNSDNRLKLAKSWVLLTDMAHNYLAWFEQHILADSPFAGWGPLRITRDLFRIPGQIKFTQDRLLSVKLLHSSPFAADLLACLARFWD